MQASHPSFTATGGLSPSGVASCATVVCFWSSPSTDTPETCQNGGDDVTKRSGQPVTRGETSWSRAVTLECPPFKRRLGMKTPSYASTRCPSMVQQGWKKEEQKRGGAVQTVHSLLSFLMFSTTSACECFESLSLTHTHTSLIRDHEGTETQMRSAIADLQWLPLFSCLPIRHDLVDVCLQRPQTVPPQGETCLVL